MPPFEYRAVDDKGRKAKGVLTADSEQIAYRDLRQQRLYVTELRPIEAKAPRSPSQITLTRSTLSDHDRMIFTQQFATLLRAGLAIDQVLGAMMSARNTPTMSRIAASLQQSIRTGLSLAGALQQNPAAFPSYFPAVVAAGERTGHLAEVLEQLSTHLTSRASERSKAVTALIYPAIVATMAVLVVIGLFTFVAPELVSIFERNNQTLPAVTRLMFSLGDIAKTCGPYALVAGICAVAALFYGRRRPGFRLKTDGILLSLPLIGHMIHENEVSMFLRTFALVMTSRVPAVDGLELSTSVLTNAAIKSRATQVAIQVREGRSLSKALSSADFLPPIALLLIEDGDRSSQMEIMAARAASIVEQQVSLERQRLVTLIEPAMMLFVGGLVLVVILSILLPVFDMQSIVAR